MKLRKEGRKEIKCITTAVKKKSEKGGRRNGVHLLVMIAERVWKTKFWNVHQSSFSIPGMRGRGKRKQLRPASSPNESRAPSETTLAKSPSSTAPPSLHRYVGLWWIECVCVSMCVVCVCVYVYMRERERNSVCLSVCKWMCVYNREREREGGRGGRGEGQIDREVKGGWETEKRRQQRDER